MYAEVSECYNRRYEGLVKGELCHLRGVSNFADGNRQVEHFQRFHLSSICDMMPPPAQVSRGIPGQPYGGFWSVSLARRHVSERHTAECNVCMQPFAYPCQKCSACTQCFIQSAE